MLHRAGDHKALKTAWSRIARTGTLALVLCLLLGSMAGISACAADTAPAPVPESGEAREAGEASEVFTARPSDSGQLHVEGTCLVDEKGRRAALRGVSTHGLTWYPDFVDEKLFAGLSDEWNCDLVRLAMYSREYSEDRGGAREKSLTLMRRGIDAAIAADMYVLVDWHILDDNDPNENIEEAAEFFSMISREYAGVPNLLYEICNEPNGPVSWAEIRTYAEQIIPLIRANSPDAVIIVGTPDFDRQLMVAGMEPLAFDNIMYTCHFYTATHKDALLAELSAALDRGIPVFITECGVCEHTGDGVVDLESAAVWFDFLKKHDLSYAVWSFSNKAESSAMIRPNVPAAKALREESLTRSGRFVRALIRGEDPAGISREQGRRLSLADHFSGLLATAGAEGLHAAGRWPVLAAAAAALLLAGTAAVCLIRRRTAAFHTYDDLEDLEEGIRTGAAGRKGSAGGRVFWRSLLILVSTFFTLVYLIWRIRFSVPVRFGWIAVAANIILLAVELLGFAETLIHYESMAGMREHPLPSIPDSAWPDVDVFVSTYNEPTGLLRRTLNGCLHMEYPDMKRVHIWLCDDGHREEMKNLAAEMGVGYLDRDDHEGAKAGNLNHALGVTSSPYIVTFDADMIPRSEFLLKTIPYFVDAELRSADLPEKERIRLGLLQTPQSFYDPDVFQHALYSERRAPNEQDFFYRTIEAAKTSTNSVIYGGSNTVLSRQALEAAGGFYTGSVTEDFATGLLIESEGFVSLGLAEPLASGRTPHTFREHIQQRTRWARGVIVTAKKLGIRKRKGLSFRQKLSYWSSVVYWYSPVKNLIYVLAPLVYGVFAVPVFRCSWLELVLYWLPMFLMQEISLRVMSRNSVSTKWSGIYETSVMPHLLLPVIKESLGITMTAFKVTDKSDKTGPRQTDHRAMLPFALLILLSVLGIVRVLFLIDGIGALGILILLFWMVRNLYYLIMAVFLIDGRDSDSEPVHVYDAEPVVVTRNKGGASEGITTHLTEHSVSVFLDEDEGMKIGDGVSVAIDTGRYSVKLSGIVIGITNARTGGSRVYNIELMDTAACWEEYMQILYDRIPTMPQSLRKDLGLFLQFWNNLVRRLARTSV